MSNVEDTVKEFWTHRPRRSRSGHKIAGVAAGIGARYRIDPVIVRVAFVVTAIFGGAGVLLYLLGWLFLPDERDEVSPFESLIGRGRSSTSTGFTVLLCVALIPACSWFFGGTWFFGRGFSGFLGLVLMLGGLYLLQRSRGRTGVPAPDAPTAATGTVTADLTSTTTASTTTDGDQTPPAWDPLGAAPFAWDLPDPDPGPPPPAPAPRRRVRIGLIALGTALVSVAICVGLAPIAGGWMTPAHVIGVVLGVLGIGMVAGSLTQTQHAGRGLIGPALALATVGVLLTALHAGENPFRGGVGNQSYSPTSIADVRPEYHSGAGDLNLNLTRLPASGEVRTRVYDSFGNARITVPAGATVDVHCHSGAGNMNCLGEHDDGVNVDINRTDGTGPLRIDLDATTIAGNVEVSRG